MLQPAPLRSVFLYPVTAAIAGAAVAVTVLWWLGRNTGVFFMTIDVPVKWELWRAVTSILPHVNFFHLAFNLYWFWVFGTFLERAYGHLRFLAIVLLLALGSSLAEFAVLNGGVGLSGVGYGLWAMLWVLNRRDPRFAGVMDAQTSRLFVIWFFLCIALTITNVMRVANIAHGMGAVLGFFLGLIATSSGLRILWNSTGLVACLLWCLTGSTVLWPRFNLSADAQADAERAGIEALTRSDNPRGLRLLKLSAHMKNAPARTWFNLGVAYHRTGNAEAALAAYEHAAAMPDATKDMYEAAQTLRAALRANQALPDSRKR